MLRAASLLVLMLAALPQAVVGQDYPRKPIRLIMPNAPGSSIDVLGRIAAQKLGAALGEQIVVENRAGAGGIIGMERVKTASADGYTPVAASTAAMTIIPNLRAKLPYDPLKDFAFISTYAITPNALVVNPDVPVRSAREHRGRQTGPAAAARAHAAGTLAAVPGCPDARRDGARLHLQRLDRIARAEGREEKIPRELGARGLGTGARRRRRVVEGGDHARGTPGEGFARPSHRPAASCGATHHPACYAGTSSRGGGETATGLAAEACDEEDDAADEEAGCEAGRRCLEQQAREVGEHGPAAQAARRRVGFGFHEHVSLVGPARHRAATVAITRCGCGPGGRGKGKRAGGFWQQYGGARRDEKFHAARAAPRSRFAATTRFA